MDTELHHSLDVIEAHLGHRLACEKGLAEYVSFLMRGSRKLRDENVLLATTLAHAKDSMLRLEDLMMTQSAKHRDLAQQLKELLREKALVDSLATAERKAEVAEAPPSLTDNSRLLLDIEEANRHRLESIAEVALNGLRTSFMATVPIVPPSPLQHQQQTSIDNSELGVRLDALEEENRLLRDKLSNCERKLSFAESEIASLKLSARQKPPALGHSEKVTQTAVPKETASLPDPPRTAPKVLTLSKQRSFSKTAKTPAVSTLVPPAAAPRAQPRAPPPPARAASPANFYYPGAPPPPTSIPKSYVSQMLKSVRKDPAAPSMVDALGPKDPARARVPPPQMTIPGRAETPQPVGDEPRTKLDRITSKSPLRPLPSSPQPTQKGAAPRGFSKSHVLAH